MVKTILITGATDGIGRETARRLARGGHRLLVHGRNAEKLEQTAAELRGTAEVETFRADLSGLPAVARLAQDIRAAHSRIDGLINNAGVYKASRARLADGQDVRFVVNTLAPALLARALLPVIPKEGRIVHLSSAAQAPVDLEALEGRRALDHMEAYAQSKLALTMWSQALAAELPDGPVSVAVNPGSLLASKMVREGFGVAGSDIGIGAEILERAVLSEDFRDTSGLYFDNDSGAFAAPHADAADAQKSAAVIKAIEARIAPFLTADDSGGKKACV